MSLKLRKEKAQQRIDYWHVVGYLGRIVESSSLHKASRKHNGLKPGRTACTKAKSAQ